VSGVPGLGHALQHNPQLRHTEWKYHRSSKVPVVRGSTQVPWASQRILRGSQRGVSKANSHNIVYHGSPSSSTSSLVVPRQSCQHCGHNQEDSFPASLSGEDSSCEDSHRSSSSLDSIDYMLDRCLNIKEEEAALPTPPTIHHSRSLNSLPQHHSNTTASHRKLERSVIKPRVTFSELTENINVIVEEHKKLSRKENILSVKGTPKSILHVNSRHTSANDSDTDTLVEHNASDTESESHYKTLKEKDENYSYAYRDSFSPAIIIKQDVSGNVSEYSEDIYEVIEPPDAKKKESDEASHAPVTTADPDNPFFLSISKGRRNHLKLHRFVDWDLDTDIFPLPRGPGGGDTQAGEEFPDMEEVTKEKKKAEYDDILTEERRDKTELRDRNDIKYCRYKNYKNVRSSKIRKVERGRSQVNQQWPEKDHLKIKQSISKKLSSISFFAQKKERKLNLRKTLRRKLSSMVVSMMNVF